MAEPRPFAAHRLPGFATLAVASFLALYLPILTLVVYSFNDSNSISQWGGLSLRWYREAWANAAVQDAAIRSLAIATVAAAVSTAVATLAALGTVRQGRYRGRTLIYALINQPLMVPEIVTAVALLIVFGWVRSRTGYQGLGYLMLAHSAFCIPFAYLPIRARLDGMNGSYEEAAQDLYANRFRTFRRVTLPLLWPGVLAGFTLAFVTSLDDFLTSFFLSGPGTTTLPVYIFSAIRAGITPEINAISTVMLVISIILVSLSFALTRLRR